MTNPGILSLRTNVNVTVSISLVSPSKLKNVCVGNATTSKEVCLPIVPSRHVGLQLAPLLPMGHVGLANRSQSSKHLADFRFWKAQENHYRKQNWQESRNMKYTGEFLSGRDRMGYVVPNF